jgi:endonuclease YncB( thermonuclease family)
MRAVRTLALTAVGVAASGCPYQPVIDEPCAYDPTVGNCFEANRTFNFDDTRVDAIDLASLPQATSACRDPVRGTVTRVVDGDTFDVLVDGASATERIRLIGVDTPETYVETGYPHCYGADAKLFTEELTGRRVALSFDRGCDDGNMRTLAYVWLGPRENDSWQRQLLRRGYAHELVIAPNDLLETTYLGDEAIAMAQMRGQWLECR